MKIFENNNVGRTFKYQGDQTSWQLVNVMNNRSIFLDPCQSKTSHKTEALARILSQKSRNPNNRPPLSKSIGVITPILFASVSCHNCFNVCNVSLLAFSINCADQSVPRIVKGLFTKTPSFLGTKESIP